MNYSLDKTEQIQARKWCKSNFSNTLLVRNMTSTILPAMVRMILDSSAVKTLMMINNFQPMKNKVQTREQFVSHVSKTKISIQTCMTHLLRQILDTNFQSAGIESEPPAPTPTSSQFKYLTQLHQSKQSGTGLYNMPAQSKVTQTKMATKAEKKKLAVDKKQKLMLEAAEREAAELEENKPKMPSEEDVTDNDLERKRKEFEELLGSLDPDEREGFKDMIVSIMKDHMKSKAGDRKTDDPEDDDQLLDLEHPLSWSDRSNTKNLT
jgi:hypothetical protein